jgi:exopolysaccharide biosynthesis polyprenyl glycosylphosphotransferase
MLFNPQNQPPFFLSAFSPEETKNLEFIQVPLTTSPYWVRCLSWIFDKPWRSGLTLVVLDILAASLGLMLGILLGTHDNTPENLTVYVSTWVLFIVSLLIILFLKNAYDRLMEKRSYQELRSIFMSSFWAILLVLASHYIFIHKFIFSRLIISFSYIFSLLLLIIFRFSLRELIKKVWDYGLLRENVIVIGDSFQDMKWLLGHLNIQKYRGFNILGYLAQQPSSKIYNGLPYLGNFQNLAEIKKKTQVNKVLFAMRCYNDYRNDELLKRLEECAKLNISAMIISRIFNEFYCSLMLDNFSGIFVVDRRQPAYARPIYCLIKRSLDIFASLVILILSMPIWLVIMICIKFHDGGPIFFLHRLVGKDSRIFYAIKFRTMVVNAEELLKIDPKLSEKFKKNYKLKDDPRVTSAGKWLRKYSLDELPQFINILKGEMSLVGPRPAKEEELDRYGEFKEERLKVRPGVTGFWQVNGRSNTTYEERAQMDKFYIHKCNIWMDLTILLKTPIKVLSGEGAV